MADKEDVSHDYHFWESEVELVRKKSTAPDGKKFRYFDDKGIFNFVFLIWVYKWVRTASERYLDPYMLHPLPLSDQINYWQPIFSKHISDGIASLETYESLGDEKKRVPKPAKYILWRAVWSTFWKRILTVMFLVLVINAVGMSVAIFLHRLLNLLSENDFKLASLFSLALFIVIVELCKEISMDHFDYYVRRLEILMDICLRITVFQHGVCYRRDGFSNFKSKKLGHCKSIIHSCSGKSACADNPLICPARRFKGNEVTPKMYSLVLNDSYYIPLFIEAITDMIDFLTTFVYGIIIMSSQFHVKSLTILILSLSLVSCMFVVELSGGFLMKYYFGVRDHRISKSEHTVSSLDLIDNMALDDIGHDIITEVRNDELVFVVIRFLLSLLNKVIFTVVICVDIIILVNDFMSQVEASENVKKIKPSGLLASIFVIMNIIRPLYMVTVRLKLFVISFVSFRRLEVFLRTCSPNFYLPDNKFTGKISLPEALPDKDKDLPRGMLIMFENASFAWVNSRKDLLDKTGTTCLENINFVLNTGNLAIVTGANGSGKSNFVKAILGDMTLVEGSMAVLPLSTNMPIFYASQDVWLQKGTIKSNITFGHKFDASLYRMVIKAMELEHDISTWEGGDLRTILEHGYSLSGGQRMRIGLARAVYAYLIYSKVSKEEGSKCSFLVVIDDSFTGLDPFVARTIFKNLFDKKRGLLSGNDVSTVLTISKRILDACVSSESSSTFPDAPIYTLKDKTLVQMNTLKSLIDDEVGHLEPPKPSVDRTEPKGMPSYVRRNCLSDDFTRERRQVLTELKYAESPTVQILYRMNAAGSGNKETFKPLSIYFRAAGWSIIVFFILTFTFVTLDNTKFIITSRISDFIIAYAKANKSIVSLAEIKAYCIKALKWVIILSGSVIAGAVIRIIAMSFASFNVSKRIHEYAVNSLFVNSSAVLKIKKSLSSILTFLYMDTFLIDNFLSYFLHDTCLLAIESGVHLLTILFMAPLGAPLALFIVSIILRFIIYYYVKACKNVYLARLEALNQMDSIIESAISGSPVYRSFKKEWELMHSVMEHTDYSLRSEHMTLAATTWTCITFRWLFSPLALFILLFPLARSRYFGVEVQVGYYAMAYSIFLSLNSSFANFLKLYCHLEISLVPMRRFIHFVPPKTPVVFEKRDICRTDVIVNHSGSVEGDKASDDNIKDSIHVRRRQEYAERRAARCSPLMMFFRHKVNILDVSEYLTQWETRIKLDNVNVYVYSKSSQDKYPILKNVTCSANVSDIVGIIGRTGAGKSTMLSVLQNLARNRDGSVLLDGCDLRDMPKNVTRQVIGVLPQLPFVFRGWTVRRFIDPRMLFDDVDIELALESCGLLKFVENLPGGKGIDTIIIPDHYHKDMPKYYKRVYYGPTLRPYNDSSIDNINVDCGMALSNSQLRTLSMVRLVLYREFFKVLLVDEPPEEELASTNEGVPIYEIIRTYFKHCTTFIAAHDASILRVCTSVWAFHNGSLIKTCKTEDIADSSSLSKIIEDCISQHTQCGITLQK